MFQRGVIMKKIAFLLSVLMLFSLMVSSCSDKGESSSVAESSEPDVSAPESSVSEEPKVYQALTGIPLGDSPNETVISANCSYTKSMEASGRYADTYGTELTDGITGIAAANFTDESLSGYESAENLDIILDLGAVYENIYRFRVGTFTSEMAGIHIPHYYDVSVSEDGIKWTSVGVMQAPELIEGTVQYALLDSQQYIMARFVKFNIRNAWPWTFLDEVQVIADIGDNSNAGDEYIVVVNNAYQQLGAPSAPQTGNAVNRNLNKTLISKGAKYSSVGTQNPNFTDEESMLTDGRLSGYYEGRTWVGYSDNETVTITLDLGEAQTDIAQIEVSVFVNISAKIYMPCAMKVTALDSADNPSDLGVIYGNTTFTNGNYNFILPLREAITAEKIQFCFQTLPNTTFLVEELGVYAYRETKTDSLYPALSFNANSTDWGNNASEEYINLIKGRSQQLYSSTDPGEDCYDSYHNSPISSLLMTDGKYSSDVGIHNGSFFKFHMGSDRKVIYDLTHISAVDKFTASFTHVESWAVRAPTTVSVLVSEDGESWFDVGNIYLDSEEWQENYGTELDDEGEIMAVCKGELVLDKKITARYIAFDFVVRTWAGCDELEVYGTKSIKNASSPESAGFQPQSLHKTRIAPDSQLLDGAKDLCLLYFTDYDAPYTSSDLLPYVAYLDREGNIEDIMFDSFLFLNNGSFPEGTPNSGSYLSDWEWANQQLFARDVHLDALNKTAEKVKSTLGLPVDYTFKVSLTLYNPVSSITDFGDVDGDGISENFSNYADKIKALKWFIDESERLFEEADFQHLELVSYYWFDEGIESSDADILKLHNEVSDYVHSLDRNFIWIPWFCAPGYHLWADHGFDVACMQPNYVFDIETDISNIENCAILTDNFGMGFEIEICEDSLRNEQFFAKYMAYLAGGAEYGYMEDTINMYYQNVTIYRDAAYSAELMPRTVYESTYHYIKGDLQYKPEILRNLSFNAEKNQIFTGNLDFNEEKLRQFRLSLTPSHGSVTLNNDGSFTYYPEPDYTGEVTFSFIYTEYLGWSDNCEVTITVN